MLSATLESLANQRLPKNRYEVVVVDDGSKDTTPNVCRDFASRMQLKYLYIENSGISAAKNTGILASRGKLLLFADDDDIGLGNPDQPRQIGTGRRHRDPQRTGPADIYGIHHRPLSIDASEPAICVGWIAGAGSIWLA
jgi:glycosyltransferase involved in cell wall biosynthesis